MPLTQPTVISWYAQSCPLLHIQCNVMQGEALHVTNRKTKHMLCVAAQVH